MLGYPNFGTDLAGYRTMQHLDKCTQLIESLNLVAYEFCFRVSNKSTHLPYHNEYHSLCMVLNCFEGAIHEKVSESEMRSLVAAALFHDFNHSGGHTDDSVNIEEALRGLFHAHTAFAAGDLALSPQEYEDAVAAIRITKYPYEESPVTAIQKIIRDADLMQVYEQSDYRLCKQFRGLKEEVEILHRRSYTIEEWATGCKAFNDAVEWHTDWARAKAAFLDHPGQTERLQQLLLDYK